MDDDLDTLQAAFDRTAELLDGLDPSLLDRPTPCAGYTVGALADHVGGWVRVFERAVNDQPQEPDPEGWRGEGHWAESFRASTATILDGLRERGADRPMVMVADPMPGTMILDMMRMEYVGHGWDLAVATGREPAYPDEAVAMASDAAHRMIQPEHRGPDSFFGPVVEVHADAAPVDRYVGFLGRDPSRWGR